MDIISNLIDGNKAFQELHHEKYKKEVDITIKNGQHPQVMFVGCSDSRVTPDLMLNTKPGDMFILRNVGNFVPPFKHDEDFHGSAAAIEYAVSVLNVKHIIICGHSYCGACKSLYQDIPDEIEMVHVKTWLKLGAKAKEIAMTNGPFKTDFDKFRATEKASIEFQLSNLLTYPEVQKRVDNGSLKIHGWYYKIEDGSLEYYDSKSDSFKPLTKKSLDEW